MTHFTRLRHLAPSALALFLLGAPLAFYMARHGVGLTREGFALHAPDWTRLLDAPAVIQLHLAAALVALAIGVILLTGVKGTRRHRILGWTWVLAMATTAISSFFIHQINPGGLSLIHALSGWTLVGLPMAVHAARRHRVEAHRRAMTGMFVGGLVVAGLLTFLPGRLMWAVFFGPN